MEAYTSFAEVYDTFMDNVPYEEWADYLEDRLKEYGVKDGLVLELGCGTGSMTELLAEKGYDMIGVCLLYTSSFRGIRNHSQTEVLLLFRRILRGRNEHLPSEEMCWSSV